MIERLATTSEQESFESPFTEIFALMKTFAFVDDEGSDASVDLVSALSEMNTHIDNALELLLQGLQDIGHVMAANEYLNEADVKRNARLGFLVSTIGNMTEALNDLRLDSGYLISRQDNKFRNRK